MLSECRDHVIVGDSNSRPADQEFGALTKWLASRLLSLSLLGASLHSSLRRLLGMAPSNCNLYIITNSFLDLYYFLNNCLSYVNFIEQEVKRHPLLCISSILFMPNNLQNTLQTRNSQPWINYRILQKTMHESINYQHPLKQTMRSTSRQNPRCCACLSANVVVSADRCFGVYIAICIVSTQ